MYSHILVCTDGSKLSQKAIKTAARLAKALGARLTGAYVGAPYIAPIYSEGMIYSANVTRAQYEKAVQSAARKALEHVTGAAKAAGVSAGTATITANTPWQGILKAAQSKKCDLIVMASHGRRGLAGLLLGSETVKVLTHSKVPVLVCR
ncbi:MAG TPA: universal stress protein [Burkholderiales bacterium]|jgi:nucleotide-binding universal stress UspA family protein|nr:universal stress protein [Burkholderiales bacterium]